MKRSREGVGWRCMLALALLLAVAARSLRG